MSSAVKAALTIVALMLIAGAIYWYTSNNAIAPSEAPSSTLPSGESTDDAALDQDLAAIDAQINAFAADNSSVDQGIDDSPVAQPTL